MAPASEPAAKLKSSFTEPVTIARLGPSNESDAMTSDLPITMPLYVAEPVVGTAPACVSVPKASAPIVSGPPVRYDASSEYL